MDMRLTKRRPTLALALSAALSVALLAGCGSKREATASQTAAKVNKDEVTVHQINHVLQQQRNLKAEQAEVAGRRVLERLIDQQLALQRADDMKLDRDPRVVQQLEAARRDIIARAYMEKVGEAAVPPTPEEVQKYYEDKPALFKERRIYNIQEVAIEATPEQVSALRTQLAQSKTFSEFTEYLRTQNVRHLANQAVRAAEQLPLQSLDTFARMKDGQAVLTPTATGATVVVLANARSQPVSLEQARPAIEQFLLNERKRKLMEDDVKAMRAAAKIEYVGKFASAASAPAAGMPADTADAAATPATAANPPPQTAAQAPADAPSGGLTASDISKGMGIGK
jgi:EpsD family peptidyl-prolyl cis-trans isomerase